MRSTAIATALVDNPVGCLVEDFILWRGVDLSLPVNLAFIGVGPAEMITEAARIYLREMVSFREDGRLPE